MKGYKESVVSDSFYFDILRQFIVIILLIFISFYFYIYDKITFFKKIVINEQNFLYYIFFILIIIFLYYIKIKRYYNNKNMFKLYIINFKNSNKNTIVHDFALLYNYIKKNFKKAYFILSPQKGLLLCVEENKYVRNLEQIAKALEPNIVLKEKAKVSHCFDYSGSSSTNNFTEYEAFFGMITENQNDISNNIVEKYVVSNNVKNSSENEIIIGYTTYSRSLDNEYEKLLPIKIPLNYVKLHTGIFGITGSGKTTTAAWLAYQLNKYKNRIIIIDWHGEYKHLFDNMFKIKYNYINASKGELPINPMDLKNKHHTLNILEDVFELTLPQSAALLRILKTSNISNIQELLALLENGTDDKSYWEKEVRHAILRKLEHMDTDEGLKLFSGNEFVETGFFTQSINVVDVSEVTNYYLKKMYVLTLLRSIHELVTKKNQQTWSSFGEKHGKNNESIFIVIDEAHNVLPKKENNFVSTVLAESRKFGLFLIIVTQSPSSINPEFLKNIGNKIVHAIRYPSDLRIVEELFIREPQLTEIIPFLRPGEFVASLYHVPVPIVGKVIIPTNNM